MKARRTAERLPPAVPALPRATCPGCGQTFIPTWPQQRHCRPSCRALTEARARGPQSGSFEWAGGQR
jgi:hypothetical protein